MMLPPRPSRPRAGFSDDDVRAVMAWRTGDAVSFDSFVAARGKPNPENPGGPKIWPPFVELAAEARRLGKKP